MPKKYTDFVVKQVFSDKIVYSELQFKNLYGIIGAILYSILRSVLVFGIVIAAMLLFVKAAFANSARAKETLKDSLAYTVIAVGLLYFTPILIDIIIYLKDIILSILGTQLSLSL